MNWDLLEPDLQGPALKLAATGRLRAETDPELFQAGMKGRAALTDFFHRELGWPLEVQELAEQIRLHKRRVDPPGDRGPLLARSSRRSRTPQLAPPLVLIAIALICEQLWRRPRIALRELMQAVAQVCATDAELGLLPPLRIVAGDDTRPQEARNNRVAIVDALKILVAEGTITVDADLDDAITDEDTDLVVRASRERLSVKFSSVSPTLLDLEQLPPQQHLAALSTETLLDHQDQTGSVGDPTLEMRRLAALRRLVDDPATDPHVNQVRTVGTPSTVNTVDATAETGAGSTVPGAGVTPYLQTLSGRDRGLKLLASLGLGATVRRDWWEVTSPTGLGTALDFPNGRRVEWQAALAIVAELSQRSDPRAPVSVDDLAELLEALRADQPRWAAGYHGRFPALARAAATELSKVALLSSDHSRPDVWHPTPGIHLWRVRLHRQPTASARPADPNAQLSFPDPDPEPDPGPDSESGVGTGLNSSQGGTDGPA